MKMLEIRFHGRGGQGAKSAAQLLAEAALEEGHQVQAFPEYGPERTGAPVRTYVRIADSEIKTMAPVKHPDVVIIIDETLIQNVDVCEGIKDKGIILVNSQKSPEELRKEMTNCEVEILAIDATSISFKHLNRNIPNTPMLGAAVKATNAVKLSTIKKTVRDHFEKKIGKEITDANIAMIEEAYKIL